MTQEDNANHVIEECKPHNFPEEADLTNVDILCNTTGRKDNHGTDTEEATGKKRKLDFDIFIFNSALTQGSNSCEEYKDRLFRFLDCLKNAPQIKPSFDEALIKLENKMEVALSKIHKQDRL